jgi:hypothetical protein
MNSEYWENFTYSWLRKAEAPRVQIDDGDRFIWLWIAFNGWMRGKFGERAKDHTLINNLSASSYDNAYDDLRRNHAYFRQLLDQPKRYDGSFANLLEVLYQVRCNLFHGWKNPEEDRKDFELVTLSFKILLPLFKNFLGNNWESSFTR